MISFYALGDFGAATPIRHGISTLLQRQEGKTAVIGLGDNFYRYGVESVNHPRWKYDFVEAFRPDCPWYVVLGNHDYLGNIQAQIEFSRRNPYWRMPARYYDQTFFFEKKKDSPSVHLFCLDTFELSISEARSNSLGMGMSPGEWSQLEAKLRPEDQLRLLDQKLESSDARWKVVAGHYPLFSCGGHGDNPELTQKLLPLFQKHKVDFYLAGHDHSLQHTSSMETQFLVSGTGCSLSQKINQQDRRFYPVPSTTPGVCFLKFSPTHCRFGFLSVETNQPMYEKIAFPNHTSPGQLHFK